VNQDRNHYDDEVDAILLWKACRSAKAVLGKSRVEGDHSSIPFLSRQPNGRIRATTVTLGSPSSGLEWQDHYINRRGHVLTTWTKDSELDCKLNDVTKGPSGRLSNKEIKVTCIH
jgi:hypothetical protein